MQEDGAQPRSRPPTGALVVVAVGLLATVAAVLLTAERPASAAELSWEAHAALPVAKPAPLPSGGSLRLTGGALSATAPNSAGERLYRVSATLLLARRRPRPGALLRCRLRVPTGVKVAAISHVQASYPRPTEGVDLARQEVPSRTTVEYEWSGAHLASVPFGEGIGRFANRPGVAVPRQPQWHHRLNLEWRLPSSAGTLRLPFASLWVAPAAPAVRVACELASPAGAAAVRTRGGLRA